MNVVGLSRLTFVRNAGTFKIQLDIFRSTVTNHFFVTNIILKKFSNSSKLPFDDDLLLYLLTIAQNHRHMAHLSRYVVPCLL